MRHPSIPAGANDAYLDPPVGGDEDHEVDIAEAPLSALLRALGGVDDPEGEIALVIFYQLCQAGVTSVELNDAEWEAELRTRAEEKQTRPWHQT